MNPVQCVSITNSRFDIKLADGSRNYHMRDKKGGAARWVNAITALNAAWALYLRKSIGSSLELADDDSC